MISVIMGIYNCADTLPEAIESILSQTYTDWQLVLCDDASKDDTYAVAKRYREQYPDKIVLIRNEENCRLAATLNHCLQYATGGYIARMDGDDLSVPDRFEKQVAFLESHPEYDLVGSQMISFDETGDKGVKGCVEKPDKYMLRKGATFCHATILARRHVYDTLQGYTVSKEIKRCEDIDLWYRFYAAGFVGYNLQEPLYKVREDMTAFKRRKFSDGLDAMKVCKRGFRLLNFPKRYYIYLLKPIVASLTPAWVMKWYHNRRDKKRSKGSTEA